MNYRQEGAGAPSALKTLPSHYICPKDAAVALPPSKLLLGFFTWECIFFPFLGRTYSSPMIQRLRQPEAGRLVGLFLFCQKACVQGKSLNNKWGQSLCLHQVAPSPTLHQLYRQSLVLYGCLEGPREFWLILFFSNQVYLQGSCSVSQPNVRETETINKSVCLKKRLSNSLLSCMPQSPFWKGRGLGHWSWLSPRSLQALTSHGSLCFGVTGSGKYRHCLFSVSTWLCSQFSCYPQNMLLLSPG